VPRSCALLDGFAIGARVRCYDNIARTLYAWYSIIVFFSYLTCVSVSLEMYRFEGATLRCVCLCVCDVDVLWLNTLIKLGFGLRLTADVSYFALRITWGPDRPTKRETSP